MALSLVASVVSSRTGGRWARNLEDGRVKGGCPEEGSAVDLELEVVGPALRWDTGCKPGRRGSFMAS